MTEAYPAVPRSSRHRVECQAGVSITVVAGAAGACWPCGWVSAGCRSARGTSEPNHLRGSAPGSSCCRPSRLDYEPVGAVEKTGDLLGIVEHRAKGDLERFKHFIESRGTQIRNKEGEMSPTREEQEG